VRYFFMFALTALCACSTLDVADLGNGNYMASDHSIKSPPTATTGAVDEANEFCARSGAKAAVTHVEGMFQPGTGFISNIVFHCRAIEPQS
jgi:hypothetical protein